MRRIFLSAWQDMLDKYTLKDNSWLKDIFAMRETWSMTYGRNTFSAVSCSCKIFEFMGILCRYALKILDILNVKDTIPAYYILKRWTKDVTNMHEMDINLVTKDSNPKVEVIARYKHLCQTFIQISSEASGSKKGYELAAIGANELITKLNDIKKRKESVEEPIQDNNIQNEANKIVFVDNSNISKVTGLKRKQPTRRSNTRPKIFLKKAL
ncbi:hypothetical protein T459_26025 [Capsicum annuum]|uniref:Protein FAR1-RELATED SEQUENCE n=1 Tax=Capsicum annuum TaxID=4072 RepID=A0A2G2YMV1_CAPAN|nr:hypothetical protein FXO37_27800 [Capsicum annuum]PHT70921.1 hypothetical protein T459_26025 [Capsicum annuum]